MYALTDVCCVYLGYCGPSKHGAPGRNPSPSWTCGTFGQCSYGHMGAWVSMAMGFPSGRDWLSEDMEAALLTLASPAGQNSQVLGFREFGDTSWAGFSEGPKVPRAMVTHFQVEPSLPEERDPG